jgi:hypothetical protein
MIKKYAPGVLFAPEGRLWLSFEECPRKKEEDD